ncbi:MAG: efflux RND transporter periplasmic adaptor subunit [Planctomycetota bacterium]
MRQILKMKWVGSAVVLLIALGAAGAVVGLTDRSTANDDPELGPRPALVRVVAVQPESRYATTRAYTGRIEARRSSALGFERSAELVEVLVEEGGAVEAGQTLARLDTRQLEAQKQSLVAERDAAQALLDELVAGPRQEDIDTAQAEVARQAALLERLKLQADRIEKLHRRSAANDDERDEILFELQANKAALAGAKAELRELTNGTRPEQLASQRARVAQLDASMASVEVDLEDSVLVAPFAGRVQRRAVDEGSVVSPGQTVLTLVQGGPREATVGLPWEIAESLEAGQTAALEVGPRQIDARVRAVLPTVDEATRTVEVVLDLPESSATKQPGSVVRWALPETINEAGFWLPTAALARGSRGLWSAFGVSEQNMIERIDLELLHTEADRVFVRGAATAGDRIVAEGVHRLAAGQRVEIESSNVETD